MLLIIYEGQDKKLELHFLNKVDSTHQYLKQYIKINNYKKPIAIITRNQTDGIGSRNNDWEGREGNLFFSFVVSTNDLPSDLPLQSASIYFNYILKDILSSLGSSIWLKWPNDFYCEDKKIGGTITHLSKELIYCGIGLNLYKVNNNFGYLDISLDINSMLNKYFDALQKYPSWKEIFSKFEIEFHKNIDFTTNVENQKVLLKNTVLNSDGSLTINSKKVFSLR